jgi:hypothetical protein
MLGDSRHIDLAAALAWSFLVTADSISLSLSDKEDCADIHHLTVIP